MSRDGKPLELPGFYWDEERRRYFPIAHRPKQKTIDDEVRESRATHSYKPQYEGRAGATSRYLATSRRVIPHYSERMRIADEIEGRSLLSAYTELDPPIKPLRWQSTKIASLHATPVDGTLNVLVGDSGGVLHCSRAVIQNKPETVGGPDRFNDNSRLFTSYHLGAGAAVSHIVSSGDIAVAVSSTCDSCILGIRDLKAPDYSGVSFPRLNVSGDIRAASLLDKSLALGLSKKLVWAKDIQSSPKGHRTLRTGSDVLSVSQSPNTITAGLRSGEVRLFDVRSRENASTELFGSRFSKKNDRVSCGFQDQKKRNIHSAVTHLQLVSEWEMLVGTSAGQLEIFDLRFATGTNAQPTMIFKGHVNSYLLDLGITIDPSSSFLFAAGQDCRIRTWSLRTGAQIGTILGGEQLKTPSRALAVTQASQTSRGTRWLWIAQDNEVRVVRLGCSPSSDA